MSGSCPDIQTAQRAPRQPGWQEEPETAEAGGSGPARSCGDRGALCLIFMTVVIVESKQRDNEHDKHWDRNGSSVGATYKTASSLSSDRAKAAVSY